MRAPSNIGGGLLKVDVGRGSDVTGEPGDGAEAGDVVVVEVVVELIFKAANSAWRALIIASFL